MYEFIILFLLGMTIFFAYLFACKIIAVNTINRKPLLYTNNHIDGQSTLAGKCMEIVRLIINGFGDSESGFYARLSARISAATHLEKYKIETSLLCNKVSQAIILCALFLSIPLFLMFLALVLITSFVRERNISFHIIGVVMGLLLMRCCIEMGLYIGDLVQDHSFQSLPGYLYYDFSQKHPLMFLINGIFFPLLSLNFSMIFPLIFVPSVILKLSFLEVIMVSLGVFFGFIGRSYFVGTVTTGFFSYTHKENFFFYTLNVVWTLILFGFYYVYTPETLDVVMNRGNLLEAAITVFAVVVLSSVTMAIFNQRGIAIVESVFPKVKTLGHQYKYSKSLFKEADLGIKMLMNELRTISIEQSVYLEKIMQWQRNNPEDRVELDRTHHYFRERFKELKSYLTILLHNDEAPQYEENLLICAKFLDDAKQLGENFYEKFKLLKLLNDDAENKNLSVFFDHLVEGEDAIYMIYKGALETLAIEEIQLLFQIIGNTSTKAKEMQEIQNSYIDTEHDIVIQGHKWVASELTQLYQMDLWLILHQNEILEKWSISSVKSHYVLGRV
jgi:hypothetical protein